MTPHEVRIKDLTPSGLRELADAGCTIWAKSVHDENILVFLKPEPSDSNGLTEGSKKGDADAQL